MNDSSASPSTSQTAVSPPRRTLEGGLLLACLFLFFWRLGAVSVFDLDEALYVTGARQMALSGDFVTPHLNTRPLYDLHQPTVPFYEKPILVYWLPALAFRAFGVSEGVARLPTALAALLTTGLVVWAGWRWFGRRAGLLAGFLYATAPMTLVDGRQMTTDGLLALWFTTALLAFWECHRAAMEQRSSRAWLLFWIACALAVLTKGVVGLLLPLLVIGVFLARRGFRSALRSLWALQPLLGLLLFLALIAPWHLAIYQAGGRDANGRTFVQEYLIRQHIGRFRGGDTVHNAPLPTYVVYFLIGFFPWAFFVPAAFRWQSEKTVDSDSSSIPPSEVRRFLLVWFWTIFVFFTLGAAKLPTYIVPLYPAAALLVGRWLDQALHRLEERPLQRSLARGALGATCLAALLSLVAVFGPRFAPANAPVPSDVAQLVLHITLLLLGGSLLAWGCFHGGGGSLRWRKAGIGILVGTMLGLGLVGFTEGYQVAEREVLAPYQHLARQANTNPSNPIIYYHIIPRRPSMLFYARYSPIERKETPLLPFLRPLLAPLPSEAIVITSRATLQKELEPEVLRSSDFTLSLLSQTGDTHNGWVLLRLRYTPSTQ